MAKGPFITPAERARRVKAALKLRKESGMEGHTIYWLAGEAGIHRNHVYKIMNPERYGHTVNPNLDTLQRIARALGVTVGYLVDSKET